MRRTLIPAAALLLFFAACGSSSKTVSATPTTAATAAPAAATPTTAATAAPAASAGAITIQNFAFAPATLNVPAGTTVTVTNKDSTGHTWTADGKAFDMPVAPGQSVTFTFAEKGTFTYHCSIHPSMTGTVTVA